MATIGFKGLTVEQCIETVVTAIAILVWFLGGLLMNFILEPMERKRSYMVFL